MKCPHCHQNLLEKHYKSELITHEEWSKIKVGSILVSSGGTPSKESNKKTRDLNEEYEAGKQAERERIIGIIKNERTNYNWSEIGVEIFDKLINDIEGREPNSEIHE